ncbi:alpha-amylase family glycosyl hydrolase [Carnobacterium gallinarum]|uniref:alpha-amylase family glycosyl hydrolase n=1 Tax=Carnobacterium gallinarum TaxID=2749 RepID=UPI00055188EF|nr:alpha-amylase family glycosyl hydrolase [Carnobacterium gallinarum]
MNYEIIEAPEDLEKLIIYEIATKGFTSPNGAESGTFMSLEGKMPYLNELGINGIWLSGHQYCDGNHFYNIWTEYACIRPDQLDPTLGTEAEFKSMIQTAHAYGIKVFLDVITHGVMKDSSLVKEHPDWFNGESWGMKDFDWYGGKKELDEWWIETWLRYITEFDIDGYRLDVAHYRNDLWAEIRKRSLAAGKRMILIAENGPSTRGVIDLLQHGESVSHNFGVNQSSRILSDVGGYFKDRQSRVNDNYEVEIFYTDGTVQNSRQNNWYEKGKVPELIWEGTESRIVNSKTYEVAFQEQVGKLRIENSYGEKEIKNIQMQDRQGQLWNSTILLDGIIEVDYRISYQKKANQLLLEFPLRIQDGQYMSVQLSGHDNGWEGYPLDKTPYAAQGSRYLLGYTALLAPGIPIFMAGEEFDAGYRPLPNLAPNLFGKERIGEGRWLYGSWLDWDQLEIAGKRDTLNDTKRIIAIRKQYADVMKPLKMGEAHPNFGKLNYKSSSELPVPYYYQSAEIVLVICANPSEKLDVSLKLEMEPVLSETIKWEVTALFGQLPNQQVSFVGTPQEIANKNWEISRDKSLHGGLLVLKMEKLTE